MENQRHIPAHRASFVNGNRRSLGMRLAVECLPRTCLGNTGSEMAGLLSAHPDLGICCDVNHLVQELSQDFIRMHGSRIGTTPISDNDGLNEKHPYPEDNGRETLLTVELLER